MNKLKIEKWINLKTISKILIMKRLIIYILKKRGYLDEQINDFFDCEGDL